MCRSEKNDEKKKKMKEAMKSLVSKDAMAMNIIEAERSKYELTPEKVFSQNVVRGILDICHDCVISPNVNCD